MRLCLAAAVVLCLAEPAAAVARPPVDFSFRFDTGKPGRPADARLHILYKDPQNPDDPEGRSPALTRVAIAAPRGTVFDGGAVPACAASNAELMLLGQAGCPDASNVGGGSGSVVNSEGPPQEPFVADVTLFNYGEGIVELLEFDGNVKAADRARFVGRSKMVLHPAVVPGITEREFNFTYEGRPREAGGAALITTPRRCPRSGVWVSRLTYTVTTGATYAARSTMRCRRTRVR